MGNEYFSAKSKHYSFRIAAISDIVSIFPLTLYFGAFLVLLKPVLIAHRLFLWTIFSVSVISYFGWMVLAWAMKSIVGAPKVFCLNAECAWHSCSAFAVAVLEI